MQVCFECPSFSFALIMTVNADCLFCWNIKLIWFHLFTAGSSGRTKKKKKKKTSVVFQCESLLLVLEHRSGICSSVVRVSWQTVSTTRSAICVTVERFISNLKSGLLASRSIHMPWYFFVGVLLFLSISFLPFRLDCSLHLTSPSQQGKQLLDLQINPKLLSQEGSLGALKQTHSIVFIYFF